jgi:CheY-like chemotaxis protein
MFATSTEGAIALIAGQRFHLILSTRPLHEIESLLPMLSESDCAIFCSYPVHDSCWWLPVVNHGQKCLGAPAFRPSEFVTFLGQLISDIGLNEIEVQASVRQWVWGTESSGRGDDLVVVARVLVVDDHEVIRRGIRSLLGRDSLEVCGEAENGKQALEKVRELKPDLVILDVSMPLMSGIEAAREIRRLAPSTKIVLFSVHDSAVTKEIVQKTGADAFALKSDAATDLVVTVQRLLQPVGLCENWQSGAN